MTFTTIESFESGNLDDYSGDKAIWDVVQDSNVAPDGQYYLRFDPPQFFFNDSSLYKPGVGGPGTTFRWWVDDQSDASYTMGPTFLMESLDSGYIIEPIFNNVRISILSPNNTLGENPLTNTSGPYYMEAEFSDTGNIVARTYQSDQYSTVLDEVSVTDTTYSGDGFGFYGSSYATTSLSRAWDSFQIESAGGSGSPPTAPTNLTTTLL